MSALPTEPSGSGSNTYWIVVLEETSLQGQTDGHPDTPVNVCGPLVHLGLWVEKEDGNL